MKFSIKTSVFWALVVIAFALRLYRLSAQDLWGDEAFSISLSQMPLDQVIAGGADTHPPLYPFLLYLALKVFGVSIFATRALSAFVGATAVPLIFVLAQRVARSARVAWFAAVLAAVSPLLVYYSQETRMYELVAMLALASVYFAARLVDQWHSPFSHPNLRSYSPLLYYFVTLLSIYTHYSAFYVVAAQNLFALLALRRNRASLVRWLGLQAGLLVAYVPWFIVQTSFLQGKASARWEELSWSGAEMIFGRSFLAFSIGLTLDSPIAQIAAAMFLAVMATGMYAIFRLLRGRGHPEARSGRGLPMEYRQSLRPQASTLQWIAPIYFFIPILVAFLVNPIFPFFFERYVLVALPGFYLTIALGLDLIARREFRVAFGVAALLVMVSFLSLVNFYFNDAYSKGKYGQMMAYIAAHEGANDALVLNNPLQKPLYNYYAPRDLPVFYLPDGGVPLEDPAMRRQLTQIGEKYSRVWLVMFGNPAEYDPTDYLKHWLGANAFKSYFQGYVDAELTMYEMPRQPLVKMPVNAVLGEKIKLVSFFLDRVEATPGQTVQLTLQWQSTAPIAKAYVAFAHLIGLTNPATQSPVWAQLDNEPVGGSRATTTWKPGETIDDRYGLQVPTAAPPGEYEIEVGMYDPESGVRVAVVDYQGNPIKENRVLLGVVRVK